MVEVARRQRAGVEQRRRQSPALGLGDLRLGSRRVIRRPRRRLQELRDANLLQLFAGEAADSRAKRTRARSPPDPAYSPIDKASARVP